MTPLLTERKKLYLFAAALTLVAAGAFFILRARREKEVFAEQSRFLMGTYCTIKASGGENVKESLEKAMDRMAEVYEKFNLFNQNSPVYRFNNLGKAVEDEEVIALAEKSLEISTKSGGAFDITVYPLVQLWGFDTDSPSLPDDDKIKSVLNAVGREKIEISGGRMVKTFAEVKIDMGGVAKGYAVDAAAEVLKEQGIDSALIDAGGDIYTIGKRGNRKWKVGIRHPRSNTLLEIVEVSGLAVATSGDYEGYFLKDEKRYHHVLDPRTGFPARNAASVTVLAEDTASADAWATAFFVMPNGEAIELAESMPEIECMIITPAMEVIKSGGFRAYLQ